MFKAHIVLDTMSPDSIRLTTFHLRYPRIIHPELMTHRVFSRNARSSRAVPVMQLLEEDIYVPHMMKNRPGMQAFEELSIQDLDEAQTIWEDLAAHCMAAVKQLQALNVHKQWANRPLEWFGWIDVLVTSTYWENFWALRRDEGAQPEIRKLADMMYAAMDSNYPTAIAHGEWHLPYVLRDEQDKYDINMLLKLSTARCARLSYKPFDGDPSIERELERYEKLIVSQPVHASPTEHQATPDRMNGGPFLTPSPRRIDWEAPHLWGNFFGWKQHRKLIPNESQMEIQTWG